MISKPTLFIVGAGACQMTAIERVYTSDGLTAFGRRQSSEYPVGEMRAPLRFPVTDG